MRSPLIQRETPGLHSFYNHVLQWQQLLSVDIRPALADAVQFTVGLRAQGRRLLALRVIGPLSGQLACLFPEMGRIRSHSGRNC